MKFFLWLDQGGGCDYMIGCGKALYELKGAQTTEEARAMVPEALEYYGIDAGDRSLVACQILSVVEDAMPFVEARLSTQRNRKSAQDRSRKKAEFDKLKRELGE